MLRIWIVGNPPFPPGTWVVSSSSAIALSNLIVQGTGAQSVTADRDTRRSDGTDKYKGVQ